MTRTQWLIFGVVALLVAGGTAFGVVALTRDSSPSSSEASSEPTGPAPASISDAAACELIFNSPDDLTQRSVDWVAGDDAISQTEARRILEDLDELRDIATRAQGSLKANLITWTDEIQNIYDDAAAGDTDGVLDTTTFKAAGLEIAHICQNP